jgi:hypothetical protein
MTTNYGQNGDKPLGSTVPMYNVTQIQASPDVQLMDYCMGTPQNMTAQHIKNMGRQNWVFGFGSLLIARNDRFYSMFKMTNTISGEGYRNHGRIQVIANTGNLPVPQELLNDPIFMNLPKDEQTVIMREYVKFYMDYVGVSIDQCNPEEGPANIPSSIGVAVINRGQMTVSAFTSQPIPPFTRVVWDLISSQQVGRHGTIKYAFNGPEQYPVTLRAHDPHNPTRWIQVNGRAFTRKLEASRDARGASKYPAYKMLNVSASVGGKKTVMMEADSNTCKMVMGAIGIIDNFLLRELSTETDADVKTALGYVRNKVRTVYAAIDLEKYDNDTTKNSQAVDEGKKVVINLCKALFDEPVKIDGNTDSASVKTLQKSATTLFIHSIQDTAATTNKSIGRILNVATNSQAVKANSGTFKYDLLMD